MVKARHREGRTIVSQKRPDDVDAPRHMSHPGGPDEWWEVGFCQHDDWAAETATLHTHAIMADQRRCEARGRLLSGDEVRSSKARQPR